MSHQFKKEQHNAITDSDIARVLPCKELDLSDPFKWLSLAYRDWRQAKGLASLYGVVFALIPMIITFLVGVSGWHVVIFPALICFMLLGPYLAASLYDISREIEHHHKPSLAHCAKAIKRNAVNEWAFGVLLLVLMIFWLRIASILHVLYPPYLEPNLINLLPFILAGTAVGVILLGIVFMISAFTQPILMDRRVDLATALLTSINAVWLNKTVMLIWAGIILLTVVIGFLTAFIGFIFLMPIIGFASWHAYIDCIETKVQRKYE